MSDEKDTAAIHRTLEQLAENPSQFEPDKFHEMEVMFGDTNANAFCPCGSKATFSGCCRNRWLPAKRAWTRVVREGKQSKKADVKHMKEQTDGDDIVWGGMIGFSKSKGPIVAPCPGQEGFDLSMLIETMPGIWSSLLSRSIQNQMVSMINGMAAQAKKDGMQKDIIKPILSN